MDAVTLSLSKKYTDDTANALGAVKGANATVESISPVEGGNQVVFAWTGTDGKKQTQTMFVADGRPGKDGDPGPPGKDGKDGKSGFMPHTEYLDGDEICDYYAIKSNGEAVLASGYGCSSFINCYGCTSINITLMQLTASSSYGLAFYDENKQFLSFVPSLVGSEKASVLREVEVPEGAHYFKASFFNYEQQKEYGSFSCTLVFDANETIKNGKRPYQDGYIFFSQRVNQSITRYWETDEAVKNTGEYKVTTGVLALPKTYSQTGKKTPLIVYAHGLSHYVYYGAWGNTDAFREQKQHWLDMGFAVMDCNGARDNNRAGQFASGICPQGVNAYKQCVDYVVEHYNVDREIYLIGGSCGGAIAWNYLSMYGSSVKAAVMISVWADSEFNAWGGGGAQTRKLFVEYLGFNDTNTYEVDKTIGFDQKYRIITIGNKDYCFMPHNVPIYGLYGGTETSLVDPMKKTFAALRNAGASAQIRGVAGCGHEIVSGANIVVDAEIGNWFLSHSGPVEGAFLEVPDEPETPDEPTPEPDPDPDVPDEPDEPDTPVEGNDLTSLFAFDRKSWMAVTNPMFKASSNFMSCFADLSAYVGKTIEITVPQYTASNGAASTGMTMFCTQPEENTSYIRTRVKVWDTDTNGNGKGVLVPVRTVVPAEAPYLWTSTYMEGVAAYVGPNDGLTDFYCVVVE